MDNKYKPVFGPEYHRAMHGLRSSSATSPQKDRRTRRARTRSTMDRREIRMAS